MPRQVHPHPFIVQPPADLLDRHPELRRLSHTLSLKYADHQVVTEQNLQVMGSALWDALARNIQNLDEAHKAAGAAILPIIIESDKANVQALPWETLHHPVHGFLGKHTGFTLTRRIRTPKESNLQLDKGPLRVLLFTSLPDDVNPEKGRLNVEEEQIQVQEALMPWVSKGLVALEMPDDGRFSTLNELLNSFHPHVLFLSGHGRFHHEPHTGEPPYGEFLFESQSGDSDPIKDDAIAKALIGMGVQLVVLSACETSKAASSNTASDLQAGKEPSQTIGLFPGFADHHLIPSHNIFMTRLPQLAREQDPHHLQPMDFAVIPALDRAVASASLRPAREFQHRDPSTAGQHTIDHLPHLLQNR